MRRPLLVFSLSAILFVAGTAGCIAASDGPGPQLAATCAACHRLDGQDASLPSIIGRAPDQLTLLLQAFRSGERASHIMQAVTLSLSEAEVETIAQYLAWQGKGAN